MICINLILEKQQKPVETTRLCFNRFFIVRKTAGPFLAKSSRLIIHNKGLYSETQAHMSY